MENSTALFCTTVSTPDTQLRRAAEAAASKSMHLAVLLHSEFPTLPMNAYGSMPYGSFAIPDDWPETLKAAQTEYRERTNAIEAILAEANVSADIRPLFVAHPDLQKGVVHASRTSDIACIASDLRDNTALFKEVLNAVLFHSPVPALINGLPGTDPGTVLVAWDNSLACARAVHQALPYLKRADDVQIACYDVPTLVGGHALEPGREVSAWLSHHGCNVTLKQLPSGGREIGTCILNHAVEIGADLIVAGAYGHSRLQQAVFGGTSRTLIEQSDVAVLMAH